MQRSKLYYFLHAAQHTINIRQGGKTAREISFVQLFGRELLQAKECCRHYRSYGQIRYLEEAWAIYYQVTRGWLSKHTQLLTNVAGI